MNIFKIMRNKRIFISMLGLILFIALMGFTLNRTRLTWPERFINDVFGTVQGALYRPVGAAADFIRDLGRLSDVYRENEEFRKTIAQYTQDQVRYNRLESENKRLEELLHFTERQKQLNKYQYVVAQVIGSSSNPYERTVTINLGSKNGIKEQMAVQTVEGLVGLISHVSNFTSTVTLITNLDANTAKGTLVSATLVGKEQESFGIIEYEDESGTLLMTKINETDPIKDGDVVVTSGLGSIFPKNIVIGTVESHQIGDFGLTLTAVIKPAAKFDHLREVMVVFVPDPDAP